jgi:predicted lipoprotein with Yx(FWY)xxD motif
MRKSVAAPLRGVLACAFLVVFGAVTVRAASDALTVPGDFSIDGDAPAELSIRTSPSNLPIYVFDDDVPGKSNCNPGCTGPWTPVVSSGASKPFGNWTIIEREDHRNQWAYKGHALYTYFNDTPGKPAGDGQEGKWHLFQP